jgi:hypothetical protein
LFSPFDTTLNFVGRFAIISGRERKVDVRNLDIVEDILDLQGIFELDSSICDPH